MSEYQLSMRESGVSSSSGLGAMKGSVHLKAGTLHEVNHSIIHPFTKLDYESAKLISAKLFGRYTSGYENKIGFEHARRMLRDCYRAVGRQEEPSEEDIRDYIAHHDRDGDGDFTQRDLEAACGQYLCGPGGSGYSLIGRHHEREDLIEYFRQDEDPNVLLPDLAHVGKLFTLYDRDGDGQLDRNEIRSLMIDTYKVLKRNLAPTEEDVDSYMGGKSKLNRKEYELMVINSMAKRHLVKISE